MYRVIAIVIGGLEWFFLERKIRPLNLSKNLSISLAMLAGVIAAGCYELFFDRFIGVPSNSGGTIEILPIITAGATGGFLAGYHSATPESVANPQAATQRLQTATQNHAGSV